MRDKRIRKAARKEARRLEGPDGRLRRAVEPREPPRPTIGDPDPSGVGR